MTLRSGKLDPVTDELTPSNSMAAMIEQALEDLVPLGANENPIARRKIALAIARGVIKHLDDNANSFRTTVPNTGGGTGTHQQSPTIDADLGDWP